MATESAQRRTVGGYPATGKSVSEFGQPPASVTAACSHADFHGAMSMPCRECGYQPGPAAVACPMPCDNDCDATCHECHQVPWKRTHTVESCQRPEGPEWAEWVPENERN